MIVFENLDKIYQQNNYALKQINLSITDGITTVLGPSGSGKTTLLRCINGLEKPSVGRVTYHGVEVLENIKDIRKKIGMVFQSCHLFSNLSILENLTLAPIHFDPNAIKEINTKAKSLLVKFGIHNPNDGCNNLSGGQKQRVAICRALMLSPKTLLFDEPTSALDVESIHDLITTIIELKNRGIQIVVVTHDVQFAKAISTKIIFMDNGKILDYTSKEEFFSNQISDRAQTFLKNTSYDAYDVK